MSGIANPSKSPLIPSKCFISPGLRIKTASSSFEKNFFSRQKTQQSRQIHTSQNALRAGPLNMNNVNSEPYQMNRPEDFFEKE
jgi:hypothetical protein